VFFIAQQRSKLSDGGVTKQRVQRCRKKDVETSKRARLVLRAREGGKRSVGGHAFAVRTPVEVAERACTHGDALAVLVRSRWCVVRVSRR